MNHRVRAAVVGAGYLGRFHALKYTQLPGVELVAVVDIEEERARSLASEVGACPLRDARQLVGVVDIATVAVPTTQHYQVAKVLMEAGVHLLVEKPLAASLEEGEELVELSRSKGTVLQVGHVERFNSTIRELRKRISEPLFAECERISPYPGRGSDVDVILDVMIHDIDLVMDIFQGPPQDLEAVGVPVMTSTFDMVNARLKFPKGKVANLTASRVSSKSFRKVRVFQPDLYLSADCLKGEIQWFMRVRNEGEKAPPSIIGQTIEVPKGDALLEEVKSFLDAVITGKKPVVDGETGLSSLRVALAIRENAERNFPEELKRLLVPCEEEK